MTAIDFLENKRISRKLIIKLWGKQGEYFYHNLKEIDRVGRKPRQGTINKLIRLCDELGIETSLDEIKKYF